MLISFKKIDSTQTFIKRHINSLPTRVNVFAQIQTNGYGRTGLWQTNTKANFHLSMLFKYKYSTPLTSPIISLALIYTLKACGINAKIVLPNDIYIHEKKIAGILLEQIDQNLIIGIGLNLNQVDHSFTSIKQHSNRNLNLSQIQALFHTYFQRFSQKSPDNLLKKWREHLFLPQILDLTYLPSNKRLTTSLVSIDFEALTTTDGRFELAYLKINNKIPH